MARGLGREAFLGLYDREAQRLLRFFAGRAPDPETARDLWAETLAEAFRCRGRCRATDDAQLRSWLYGIAFRQLADHHRSGAIERRAMRRLGLDAPPLSDADVERLLDRDEAAAALGDALERLPPGQAAALRRRVVDEEAYADVAAALSISEPAARARVSRALRALSARLSPPEAEAAE